LIFKRRSEIKLKPWILNWLQLSNTQPIYLRLAVILPILKDSEIERNYFSFHHLQFFTYFSIKEMTELLLFINSLHQLLIQQTLDCRILVLSL